MREKMTTSQGPVDTEKNIVIDVAGFGFYFHFLFVLLIFIVVVIVVAAGEEATEARDKEDEKSQEDDNVEPLPVGFFQTCSSLIAHVALLPVVNSVMEFV